MRGILRIQGKLWIVVVLVVGLAAMACGDDEPRGTAPESQAEPGRDGRRVRLPDVAAGSGHGADLVLHRNMSPRGPAPPARPSGSLLCQEGVEKPFRPSP